MEQKSIRKAANKWEQAGERALIEIWSGKMSQLRGCRKNSHILLEMVQELQKDGYVFSVVELKTKIHNLSARYRKEKQKVGTTGGSPSEWDLYTEMQALLAPCKSYHSENLVVDSINNINSDILLEPLFPVTPSPLPSSPAPTFSVLPSTSAFVATPQLSPSMAEDSTPPATSSTPVGRKKQGLPILLKKLEQNIETIRNDIKTTSERFISIEEEKKGILKSYVEKEAEVQNALIEFLKRQ